MFSEPVIALSQKKCKHITDSYYQKHLQKHNMKVIAYLRLLLAL